MTGDFSIHSVNGVYPLLMRAIGSTYFSPPSPNQQINEFTSTLITGQLGLTGSRKCSVVSPAVNSDTITEVRTCKRELRWGNKLLTPSPALQKTRKEMNIPTPHPPPPAFTPREDTGRTATPCKRAPLHPVGPGCCLRLPGSIVTMAVMRHVAALHSEGAMSDAPRAKDRSVSPSVPITG